MKEPDNDDHDARHSANITVLIVAAVIVIVGLVLFHFISENLKMERCLEEHRHDCDPVVTQDQ